MTRDEIVGQLRARLPDFAGFGYEVAFDLGDEGVVAVDGTQQPPVLSDTPDDPACTIRTSPENMAKLMTGALNPMLAYTLGKLKIEGSMGVAMKVASLLEE
jgi:putative sterol carrier protein